MTPVQALRRGFLPGTSSLKAKINNAADYLEADYLEASCLAVMECDLPLPEVEQNWRRLVAELLLAISCRRCGFIGRFWEMRIQARLPMSTHQCCVAAIRIGVPRQLATESAVGSWPTTTLEHAKEYLSS